jgi:hypothetical protein
VESGAEGAGWIGRWRRGVGGGDVELETEACCVELIVVVGGNTGINYGAIAFRVFLYRKGTVTTLWTHEPNVCHVDTHTYQSIFLLSGHGKLKHDEAAEGLE